MEKKNKPKTILVEKPRNDSRKSDDLRFTDKARKQEEAKNHTVGGF